MDDPKCCVILGSMKKKTILARNWLIYVPVLCFIQQSTAAVRTLVSTMITLKFSLHNIFDNIRPLEVKWHLMLATCYRKSG